MEYYKHPPELSAPPPETGPLPELELAAPPPEFGQGSGPQPEAPKKRRLRQLLLIPALLVSAFLCFHNLNPAAAPTEPVAEPTSPTAQTAPPTEAPTQPPEAPQGSVVIDVTYAGRRGDTVVFSYQVYSPIPSLDADLEEYVDYEPTPWPVAVYTQVSDEAGRSVSPETDPDVWTEPRVVREYSVDAAGLEGELTLTLLASYEEEGEQRQTVYTTTLELELPPAPALDAYLFVKPGGGIEYKATLTPQPEDDHAYELRINSIGTLCYDGGEVFAFSFGEGPAAMPLEYDPEHGWLTYYSGPSGIGSLPESSEVSIMLDWVDDSTGAHYYVESNRVPASDAATAFPVYPLEEGTIVVTVYNDTWDFQVPSVIPNDAGVTILAQERFPESEFSFYIPPSYHTPSGYSFGGWVVDYGNPFDNGYEREIYTPDLGTGEPPVERLIPDTNFCFDMGPVLTQENVVYIPPSEDGVRYVNIHAAWIAEDAETGGLLLDDNMGNVTAYSNECPLVSEGNLYLCAFPVPQQEGYVFDGWYTAEGKRVYMLNSWYSFIGVETNPDGSFAGYNGEFTPVTLYAHWKPAP